MIRRPPRSTLFPTRRSSDLSSGDSSVVLAGTCTNAPSARKAVLSAAKALSQTGRSEEHTSELQSQFHLVCRLLLEKKKKKKKKNRTKKHTSNIKLIIIVSSN